MITWNQMIFRFEVVSDSLLQAALHSFDRVLTLAQSDFDNFRHVHVGVGVWESLESHIEKCCPPTTTEDALRPLQVESQV